MEIATSIPQPSPYASFLRRLAAVLLDALILLLPAILLNAVVPVVSTLLLWLLYAPFFEASAMRATIGKKIMGIQVTDMQGGRISFRASAVRTLLKLLSSCFLSLPHLLALFTPKKQALHDLVADTIVVPGVINIPAFDAWMGSVREVFGLPAPSPAGTDKITELERLQGLFERGALSREEFEAEKTRVLQKP